MTDTNPQATYVPRARSPPLPYISIPRILDYVLIHPMYQVDPGVLIPVITLFALFSGIDNL